MRVLVAALMLAATPAFAQPLPVQLKDGASWTLTVERTRERVRGTQPPQRAAFTTTSNLTWTKDQLTTSMVSAKADGAGAEELMAALGQDRPVHLDVDDSLSPERIRNWDEVRAGLAAAIEKATANPQVAEATKAIFTGLSPERAAPLIMRELTLVSLGQGADLEVGKPVPYEDLLPNPLGGPPIKTLAQFELVSYDAAKDRAVVTWKQAFDRDSATKSIAAALQAMAERVAPEQAAKAREAFANAKVDREDTCRHEIDIPTGLAVQITCMTSVDITVQGETGKNVDRWTITQSLPKTNP